jgi:hypothetical protein
MYIAFETIVRTANRIRIFLLPKRSDNKPQTAVSTAPLRYATEKITPTITVE